MIRRYFIVGALALAALPSSASAKRRRRRSRERRPQSYTYTMHRVRGGWITPSIIALGTIIVLTDGRECRAAWYTDNGTFCEEL
jgi:hypothetical protein